MPWRSGGNALPPTDGSCATSGMTPGRVVGPAGDAELHAGHAALRALQCVTGADEVVDGEYGAHRSGGHVGAGTGVGVGVMRVRPD
jgi:hypothetical protein